MTPEAEILRRFEDRAERQLRKRQLPLIIGRATDTREIRRRQAFDGFDLPALRDAAEAIRAHTMANLDRYLSAFADAAETRGTRLHFAATAGEAVAQISRIVADAGGGPVVKTKSMLTEEIGLTPALQEHGVEVVETDLGEYIVQLAGEPPSHITAPAVHRTRAEVAQIIGRHHGRRLPDQPEKLTAFVREVLRPTFLQARVGITGVNFAVADTGSLVLVTNEGNGRLTTALPGVHVAVLGLERLVPTHRELGVLLPMLVASAVGRAVTTYVTFVNGPRLPGEADGPEELHVVVLDNGRTEVLAGEFRSVLHCIRCGACQNVCPVYRQVGGHAYGAVYGGPIGAVLTPLLVGFEKAGDLPHASSLCGACTDVCPVKIPLHEQLLALRREVARTQQPTGERAVARAWAASWRGRRRFGAFIRISRLGQRLFVRRGRLRRAPFPLSRWTTDRDLPAVARRTFREWWRSSGR